MKDYNLSFIAHLIKLITFIEYWKSIWYADEKIP